LYRALMRIRALVDTGERNAGRLAEAGRAVVAEQPLARLDYLEIVDPETLDPLLDISHGGLIVTAAYLGETRLIDNLEL
jgi:pantothenate synthetase